MRTSATFPLWPRSCFGDDSARLAFSLCVLLLLWPNLCWSADFQELPASERKQWVAEKIADLNADTLSERAMAERALLQAGPELLPLLPPPELLPNVAVRQAVREIRLRLEEAKARDSVKTSVVTIKGKLPLKDIFKQITRQTGNPIDAGQLPAKMLDQTSVIEKRTLPFWEMLELLGSEFKFQIGRPEAKNAEPPAVRLIPADAKSRPVAETTSGAFRVEVQALQLRPRFGVPSQQLLRVPLRLSAEPRLRPLFLTLAGKDFSARTAKGIPLPAFNPDAKLELPLGEEGTETAFQMDFQVPKPFTEKAVQFTGKATLTVAADAEEIAFRDLKNDAGAARRKGGVTVTLNEITFQPDEKLPSQNTAQFRITVHYDTGGPAFESHRTWMFHNLVYLEDAQGRRVQRSGDFRTDLRTDGGVIVEYHFDHLAGNQGDYKFVYVAPTLIINVPVSFDFKNLPTPQPQ